MKNAPIKYYGGKGNMCKTILSYFPNINSYKIYIEPFGGSFVTGLNKEQSKVEIYNDLEENVYSLYKTISDKNLFNEFKYRCELSIYSEQLRSEYKEKLKVDSLSIVDRAFYFFYVNRTSVNGCGGFSLNPTVRRGISKSTSDFLSSIDKLEDIHLRLSNVIIKNSNGIELINKFNREDVFIYCDPPYLHSTRTSARYKVDMSDNQHNLFLDTVLKSKAKILISGYDNFTYDSLNSSKGWNKVHFNVNTVSKNNNTPKSKIETLWMNYKPNIDSSFLML